MCYNLIVIGLSIPVTDEAVVLAMVEDVTIVELIDVLADDCAEYIILLYTNDTLYVYSVSGIRPDITTPPPILPSSITLGLSVTVTGVVPSMVVSNVNIMLLTVLVTVMISCTDTKITCVNTFKM